MNTTKFSQFLSQLSDLPLSVIDVTISLDRYIPITISEKNKDLLNFDISSSLEWENYINLLLEDNNAKVAFGGYLEKRNIYDRSDYFKNLAENEKRNIHLGIDLWCKVNTEVLAVLDDLPAVSEEEKSQKRAIEAEALLTRAYAHFMLVNVFAKHYDPATAASDLGIPIVEKPETEFIATYTRSTVQEVYDFVEQSMIKGISMVDDTFYANSGKYHFNRNAALAFASRFYLYKGDYQNCYTFSSALLDPDPDLFVRNLNSDLYQGSNISSFPQIYSSPNEQANLLLMRKISLIQRSDFAFGVETNFYFFLFITLSPFGEDQRENAIVKGEDGALPNRYENLFQRNSLNSNVGTPYHIGIAFRGEEVLLNRAESALHLGRTNEAIADLQVLTDNRYRVANPSQRVLSVSSILNSNVISNVPMFNDNQTQGIFNYLLDERRKEFLVQGLRWFDIKRFGLEVEHRNPQGTFTLTANDPRKVLQIPKTAIDVGGLEPNAR